jgi:hypothetical protein
MKDKLIQKQKELIEQLDLVLRSDDYPELFPDYRREIADLEKQLTEDHNPLFTKMKDKGLILEGCVMNEINKQIEQFKSKTAEEILDEYGCPAILFDENITMSYPAILSAMHEFASQSRPITERFLKPTDKELVEISLLFNKGKIQKSKLVDMVAMAEFIIDRLFENGNVSTPSSKEI